MFKKRIYSLIEVKNRELLGKSLFAIDLAEAGYSVVIGKKSNLYYYSKYFASGIFFFKGMGAKNLKPMQSLKSLGHKIVGYDEEGLVMNQVMSIPGRINSECMKLVEFFFTVGKKQSINTLKVYPQHKKKIQEIGNPRFDLNKSRFKKFYQEEVEKIKKNYGKFVFFPSKFTILNNALYKGIPKNSKPGPGRRILESDFEDQKKIEKKLLTFLNYFPKKYPNIKIVIKPHPIENKDYWKRLINKINCNNLILADNKYSTNSYILAAEFNVGSNCHTSLESYLFGKSTLNLRPSRKDGIIISDLIRAVSGKEVLDVKELEKVIVNWFIKKKKFQNNLNSKDKKILNFNITNTSKNMSYFFKKNISKVKFPLKLKEDKFSNSFYLIILRQIKKIRNFYHSFSQNKIKADYYKLKFSGLEINELKAYILKLCKTLNKDHKKFKVIEIHPGCFCIEKK